MVLFIGDSPSKYNKDPSIPFIGAKCEKRLTSWIKQLNISNYFILNQSDRILFTYKVTEAVRHNHPIVALGNNASKALGTINHFKLPHPSGLNRQINNKEFIDKKLKECQSYINASGCVAKNYT